MLTEQMMTKNTRKERHKQDGLNSRIVGRQSKFITKSFKNYNLKVSFKTEKTIGKLLAQNINTKPNEFNKCSVYQLIYHDCNRQYTDRLAGLSCKIPRTFPGLQIRKWKI